jgi:hypothetical protein
MTFNPIKIYQKSEKTQHVTRSEPDPTRPDFFQKVKLTRPKPKSNLTRPIATSIPFKGRLSLLLVSRLKNLRRAFALGLGQVQRVLNPKISSKPFTSVDFASRFVKEVSENFEQIKSMNLDAKLTDEIDFGSKFLSSKLFEFTSHPLHCI